MNLRASYGLGLLLWLVASPMLGPAAAQDVPEDERHDQYHQRDQHIQGVLGDVVVDRIDVIAGQVAEAYPGPHPQGRANGVEDQETPPVHAADAGDDAVRLAQALDEPRQHDDLAAVVREEALRSGQPLLGEEHVPAPSQGQRPAAEMPDGEADIVSDHGCGEADQPDRHDIKLLMPRVDGRGDQDGLAGDRYAEVFEHDQDEDRPVSELIERPGQGIEEARHRRGSGEVVHG